MVTPHARFDVADAWRRSARDRNARVEGWRIHPPILSIRADEPMRSPGDRLPLGPLRGDPGNERPQAHGRLVMIDAAKAYERDHCAKMRSRFAACTASALAAADKGPG